MHSFSPVCLASLHPFINSLSLTLDSTLQNSPSEVQEGIAAFCGFFLQLPAKCQVPVTLTQGALSMLTVTLPAKECKAAEPLKNRFMSMIH